MIKIKRIPIIDTYKDRRRFCSEEEIRDREEMLSYNFGEPFNGLIFKTDLYRDFKKQNLRSDKYLFFLSKDVSPENYEDYIQNINLIFFECVKQYCYSRLSSFREIESLDELNKALLYDKQYIENDLLRQVRSHISDLKYYDQRVLSRRNHSKISYDLERSEDSYQENLKNLSSELTENYLKEEVLARINFLPILLDYHKFWRKDESSDYSHPEEEFFRECLDIPSFERYLRQLNNTMFISFYRTYKSLLAPSFSEELIYRIYNAVNTIDFINFYEAELIAEDRLLNIVGYSWDKISDTNRELWFRRLESKDLFAALGEEKYLNFLFHLVEKDKNRVFIQSRKNEKGNFEYSLERIDDISHETKVKFQPLLDLITKESSLNRLLKFKDKLSHDNIKTCFGEDIDKKIIKLEFLFNCKEEKKYV